jgi:SpoIVB peptidase S55
MPVSDGRNKTRTAAVAGVALLISTALTMPPVAAGPTPSDCPESKPIGELSPGMVGTGWTVSSGTEPEAFSAEILGLLHDGIAPGRDMIVVETSGAAIAAAGGVWQGMSGSPVYVDDELIGAVSHVLSSGPSDVAGLTAAKDLFKLLEYPEATTADRRASRRSAGSRRDGSIITSSGAEVGNPARYRRLRLPLSISGVTDRAVNRLASTLRREHAPLTAYAGSSARAAFGGPPPATLGAGDSFSATLSYGDVTFATIGTTSLVCDGKAVAFGHPLNWTGNTEMGANAAETIGIIEDSEKGPYKLAKVQGLAGTVDQDRLAGVRASLTDTPSVVPVVAEVTADNTDSTQRGRSYGVLDKIIPSLAFYHLIGHIDSTYDQITGGSSDVTFTIEGVIEGGAEFKVRRTNLYSTHEDISIASSHELERYLWTLFTQPFEEIDFTEVKVKADVHEAQNDYRIRKVRVSKNGSRFKVVRDELKVEGGDILDLRVRVRDPERVIHKFEMQLKVPKKARGRGYIAVSGTGESFGDEDSISCFFQGDICVVDLPKGIDSFEGVLDFLENRDTSNVLRSVLVVGRRQADADRVELDSPVKGFDYISLDFPGGNRGGIEPRDAR